MTASAIALHRVSVQLGQQPILKDITLELAGGAVTALLGPNGAGKSTLLRCIARDLDGASGEVAFFGREASQWSREHLARHLGMLRQFSSLTFNFKVHEVVELGGIALDASQRMISDIARQSMRQTEILHLAERYYPGLSGGEKQRVHLARVLTQLAQSDGQTVLLLDEPTSALDLAHQHKTLALARQMAREGAAVIVVLHDLNLASQYADRLLLMAEGEIVADGTPQVVLTAENIQQVYHWPVTVMAHPTQHYPYIVSV